MSNNLDSNSIGIKPFAIACGSLKLKIKIERDGRGGWRYYFSDRTQRAASGRRFKKVHSVSKHEIEQRARRSLQNLDLNRVVLTREQFDAYESMRHRLDRLDQSIREADMTPEILIGLTVPALKLLKDTNITLAQVLDAGRSSLIPDNPALVSVVIDELLKILAPNTNPQYVQNLRRRLDCMRLRHGAEYIHTLTVQDLENLLYDFRMGAFLSDSEKQRFLNKKKISLTENAFTTTEWYKNKSVKHLFDSFRRIFIRAKSIGAWPAGSPLPTELMEQPRADQPDLPAISATDWDLLVNVLDKDEIRFVALLISDIRSAEIGRLTEKNMVCDQNGMPIAIHVPPCHAKGKSGNKKGRSVTLLPNASVFLHLTRPTSGGPMIPGSCNQMQDRVYTKARKLGIATSHNFIRRAHDTFWYGLKNTRDGYNRDSSHEKQMIDHVYRQTASFNDCVKFYRVLPNDTPNNLREWVYNWVEKHRHGVRGDDLPKIRLNPEKQIRNVPNEKCDNGTNGNSSYPAPDKKANQRTRIKGYSHLRVEINDEIPQPTRTAKGKIDWHSMDKDFLDAIAKKFPCERVGQAWGMTGKGVSKGLIKMGAKPQGLGYWAKMAAAQLKNKTDNSDKQN